MQISTRATVSPWLRPSMALRLAAIGVLLIADKLFLNGFIDFDRAQEAHGFGAVIRLAQHLGFRFLVAFAAATAVFAYVRGESRLRDAAARIQETPVRLGWLLAHAGCLAILAPLCYLMYRHTSSDVSLIAVVLAGAVIGAGAVLAAFSAMAPLASWRTAAQALGSIWWYAALAAVVGAGVIELVQGLWQPTAAVTFVLVTHLLSPIMPTLTADPVTLVLRTDRFAVQIAEVCSGLEGVGLMLAFSTAWLLFFRREFIFPRALLLIPLGVAAIFALNVVRIAALMLIGDAGFPDVAIYGFHSQAGWIAFLAVACGLVLVSRHSKWLNHSVTVATEETYNPTAVYLMPLLAVLGAGTLSRAVSSDFEFFYALRVLAGGAALLWYRKKLTSIDWRASWRGATAGFAVFLVWIIAARFLLSPSPMPAKLAALPTAAQLAWLAARIAGAVIVVPIAEELAYRGYLMRRLISPDFEAVAYKAVHWPAILATAVVFGMAHGALWGPGIIAGLAFGLLQVRSGRLGEAVLAHATANALIAATVLVGGQWVLW